MHTVYAIKSLHRNYIYVGMTIDLETRLIHHNRGYNKKTRAYRPFELIFIGIKIEKGETDKKDKKILAESIWTKTHNNILIRLTILLMMINWTQIF